MSINAKLLIEQFDQLALRLRIMLTLASSVIVFFLFDLFWFADNSQAIKTMTQEIIMTKQQLSDLVDLQKEDNRNRFKQRKNLKIKQLEQLEEQLSDLYQQFTVHTSGLIKPEEMAKVLKNIILSSESLQLERLIKQKTEDISQQPGDLNKKNEHTISLYRHRLEIVLTGDYVSTIKFLQKMEQMDKKVTFDYLEYVVVRYPKANIKLGVSTLSLQKKWIGG